MQKYLPLTLCLGAALFGAGCASSSATPAQTTETEQANYYASTDAQAEVTSDETSPAEQPTTDNPTPESQAASSSISMTASASLAFPGILPAAETAGKFVHLKTTKGEIVFELLPAAGPKAASNFVYLANKKFYDGLTFHRVVADFVIQGGDPQGSGMGGPGYAFEDDAVSLPYTEGMVAMANAGPNTNGSQFFIMLKDTPLPPSYSIFGRVVKGLDVVHKIAVGDVMTSVTVEKTK